jgi:hypothetical protein
VTRALIATLSAGLTLVLGACGGAVAPEDGDGWDDTGAPALEGAAGAYGDAPEARPELSPCDNWAGTILCRGTAGDHPDCPPDRGALHRSCSDAGAFISTWIPGT